MEIQTENPPTIRVNTGDRNEDGTFKPGISGNPTGRPKGTMKDYLRRKFMEMSDEQKEEFAKNISPEMQVKLAEGNPKQDSEIKGNLTISDVLERLNGIPKEQKLENQPPLPNQE